MRCTRFCIPSRDPADAGAAVLGWIPRQLIAVAGIEAEISRLSCAAAPGHLPADSRHSRDQHGEAGAVRAADPA